MAKCGERSLSVEIIEAVKRGELPEQFRTKDVKQLVRLKKLDFRESYVNVILANGSAETHSMNYTKYFERVDGEKGVYRLSSEAERISLE